MCALQWGLVGSWLHPSAPGSPVLWCWVLPRGVLPSTACISLHAEITWALGICNPLHHYFICKMFPISFKQIRLGLPGGWLWALWGAPGSASRPQAEPQIWGPSHSHKYLLMSCEREHLFPFWTLDENFVIGKHLQSRHSHKLISGSVCSKALRPALPAVFPSWSVAFAKLVNHFC